MLLVRLCGHVALQCQLRWLSSPTRILGTCEGAVTVCPYQGHSSVCSWTLGWQASHAEGFSVSPRALRLFLSTSRIVAGLLERTGRGCVSTL